MSKLSLNADLLMFGNDIKENILYFAGRLYGGTRSQAATVLKFLV